MLRWCEKALLLVATRSARKFGLACGRACPVPRKAESHDLGFVGGTLPCEILVRVEGFWGLAHFRLRWSSAN